MTKNQLRWLKYADKAKERRRIKRERLKPGPKPKISEEIALVASHRLAQGEKYKRVRLDLGVNKDTLRKALRRLARRQEEVSD